MEDALGNDFRLHVKFRLVGHCQRDLHAVLSEADELAGNVLVGLQRRAASSNMIEKRRKTQRLDFYSDSGEKME